jgi:hypothetical protein
MNYKESSSSNKSSQTRLELAVEHVSSNWLPFNRNILNFLKQTPDAYEISERPKTIAIIKQDLGLFTYCLKDLLSNPQLRLADSNILPFDLLVSCPAQDLKRIIEKVQTEIFHQIEPETTVHQDRTLYIPVVSAMLSSRLAPAVDLDPENTFMTAILRQLGLALIAWNYPSLFKKAVHRVAPGYSIDKAIYFILGFSSLSLALSLAQRLEISPSIIEGMRRESKDARAKQLIRICKIGESLARSEDLWMTIAAQDLAKEAITEVDQLLGVSGMEEIKKSLEENCSLLFDKVPGILRANNPEDSTEKPSKRDEEKTIVVMR